MGEPDTVVQFPNALDRHASVIKTAVNRREDGHAEWIEGTLDLACEIALARTQFARDKDFGEWCANSGFGENIITKNERAILIQWGGNPDWTRTVLEKTERRSVEHIHRNEWTVTQARNHHSNDVKVRAGKQYQEAKAFAQVAAAVTGELPTERTIVSAVGVGKGTAYAVLSELKAGHSADSGPIQFSKAQDRHVEARLKAESAKLEAELAERVRLGVLARHADYRANLERLQAEATAKWERYDKLTNSHKPPFTEAEYLIILACLHPDNSASPEKRETAFKAFAAAEFQLIGKTR